MEQYFAVVYCNDGTMHLWPGESKEDCFTKLKKMKESPKIYSRMKATTIIKRNMDNFEDGFIFGSPKSLNIMGEK